ncbi:MAG: preprotein translocase subunit YajC [Candidatus Dadabacteria bacterium]|nr:preprotein translocase subunit YajC [Candidatus Dadabacteria bacterium]
MRNIILVLTISLWLIGCPLQPGGEGVGGSPITAILPFVLIFVLFYFLILRPQQKQQRQKQDMLKNLKRGDMVITTGGIYGKILNIAEDVVTLEIAKGVSVRVVRVSISGLGNSGKEEEEKKAKEEKN